MYLNLGELLMSVILPGVAIVQYRFV